MKHTLILNKNVKLESRGFLCRKTGKFNCYMINQIYKPDSIYKKKNQKRAERKSYKNKNRSIFVVDEVHTLKKIFIHLMLQLTL